MLKTSLRHLYRDRRRIVLVLALLLGAAQVAGHPLPAPRSGLSTEALLLAVPGLIPLATLAFPHHRSWIEAVALAGLLHAALARVLQGSWLDTGSFGLYALAWAGSLAAARTLLHGRWSDRLTPPGGARLTTRFRSRAPLRALWYGLLPFPGHLDSYADPEVISAEFCDPQHRSIRLLTWSPEHGPGESRLEIEALGAFRFIRLRHSVRAGLRDAAAGGRIELAFLDHGSFREVVLQQELAGMAPRRMLRAWLDDTAGRIFDRRIAAIERGVDRRRAPRRGLRAAHWYHEPVLLEQDRSDRRAGAHRAEDRRLSGRQGEPVEAVAPRRGSRAA
jgi:hypothetical protein